MVPEIMIYRLVEMSVCSTQRLFHCPKSQHTKISSPTRRVLVTGSHCSLSGVNQLVSRSPAPLNQ